MTGEPNTTIRVLVVDDEEAIRAAYRQTLCEPVSSREGAALRELRTRLFGASRGAPAKAVSRKDSRTFDVVFCDQAESAVTEVRRSLADNLPFALVFLD